MKVWKYTLVEGLNRIDMPKNTDVLHVAEQSGSVCVWALVGSDAEISIRTFRVVGTGSEFTPNMSRYVGTALLHDGFLVLHVFEEATTA